MLNLLSMAVGAGLLLAAGVASAGQPAPAIGVGAEGARDAVAASSIHRARHRARRVSRRPLAAGPAGYPYYAYPYWGYRPYYHRPAVRERGAHYRYRPYYYRPHYGPAPFWPFGIWTPPS